MGRLNKWLDRMSEWFAARKGLLPLAGIGLVVANLALSILIPDSFISRTDLLLHGGVVLAILGFLLAWAL